MICVFERHKRVEYFIFFYFWKKRTFSTQIIDLNFTFQRSLAFLGDLGNNKNPSTKLRNPQTPARENSWRFLLVTLKGENHKKHPKAGSTFAQIIKNIDEFLRML